MSLIYVHLFCRVSLRPSAGPFGQKQFHQKTAFIRMIYHHQTLMTARREHSTLIRLVGCWHVVIFALKYIKSQLANYLLHAEWS